MTPGTDRTLLTLMETHKILCIIRAPPQILHMSLKICVYAKSPKKIIHSNFTYNAYFPGKSPENAIFWKIL